MKAIDQPCFRFGDAGNVYSPQWRRPADIYPLLNKLRRARECTISFTTFPIFPKQWNLKIHLTRDALRETVM
ncbi:hypothetical protein WL80_24605 [Burkholderia ubonensis]|nr:hypothetical protein WL80_24605 [Burkholderia ubonensis]OJB20660.1 hypothetical protein BGV54_18170 [Burkholderia ubonensis]